MTTIPAKQIVNVNPGVLDAGGTPLALNGIFLTKSPRVPVGTVQSFPDAPSVGDYFGAGSNEAAKATIYFNGFDNSPLKPGALLFAQYTGQAVGAYVRGGNINAAVSLTELKAITGSLTAIIDGYTFTAASIDLSGASSFSAAAALIATALTGTIPTAATVTGAIATTTSSFTGSISGNVLSVSNVASGIIKPGAILTGTGIITGTRITGQLTGNDGATGTYAVTNNQTLGSTSFTGTYGTLTVASVASGTLSIGQTLSGSGVTVGTQITALGTGSGLDGTYFVTPSQTAASTTITANATTPTVVFDSISGSFNINSGIIGSASTMAFPTGTIAAPLLLTAATGAVISQGADAVTPGIFMDGVVNITQNWATFTTLFNPDGSVAGGNDQKFAFAQWTNAQNFRYGYIAWDPDPTPTETVPASGCLGQRIKLAALSGTFPIYEANDAGYAAFVCGIAPSIDFTAINGRFTFAFRQQAGLVAGVSTASAAVNLAGNPQVAGDFGNGYNFYGVYATAAQNFIFLNRGTVSGKFEWMDSFINQIWLNSQLQLALLEFLLNIPSVPYNQQGYSLLQAAALGPILAALNFGAIRAGVTLSASQVAEVNNAAGRNIAPTLQVQGYFLLIQDAAPQTRQGRSSPPMTLWYVDGESVQAINLNSINVQ